MAVLTICVVIVIWFILGLLGYWIIIKDPLARDDNFIFVLFLMAGVFSVPVACLSRLIESARYANTFSIVEYLSDLRDRFGNK